MLDACTSGSGRSVGCVSSSLSLVCVILSRDTGFALVLRWLDVSTPWRAGGVTAVTRAFRGFSDRVTGVWTLDGCCSTYSVGFSHTSGSRGDDDRNAAVVVVVVIVVVVAFFVSLVFGSWVFVFACFARPMAWKLILALLCTFCDGRQDRGGEGFSTLPLCLGFRAFSHFHRHRCFWILNWRVGLAGCDWLWLGPLCCPIADVVLDKKSKLRSLLENFGPD